jgi:hypothetical protein
MLDTLRLKVARLWAWMTEQENTETYVVNVGTLPNNATKSVPHEIPDFDLARVIDLHAITSNGIIAQALPTPGYNTGVYSISLQINATNVVVFSNINATAFTNTKVYIKYDIS